MQVLVTGGTGYVGSHSVRHILRSGHRVRLLVRDASRVARVLTPLGVDPDLAEIRTGDATDPGSVRQALEGCDAVLHAAGVFSFDSRDRAALRTVNVRTTAVVLAAARNAGCDPIVYVSTFGVLRPPADDPATTAAPVGRFREPYLRGKAEAEAVARRHQDEGAPVLITYPLAMLGPCDPGPGDQVTRMRNTLRGFMPIWPTGGFPIGDVRDMGRLHATLLRPGCGPRRFMGPGRYASAFQDLVGS